MYFRFNQRFNVISVDDSFARLLSVSEAGDLSFEFTYNVSQFDVVKSNALTVNVSIVSSTIKKKPLLKDSHQGLVDTRSLVKNILSQVNDAKASIKEQAAHVIATRSSDISAFINNEIVPLLRAGVPKTAIPSFFKTQLVPVQASVLKQNNEDAPLLQFIGHVTMPSEDIDALTSSSLALDTRQTMYDMITRQGLDPSYITQMTHRSIPAQASLEGLLSPVRAPEYSGDASTDLLNYYILANQSDPSRTTVSQIPDNVTVNVAQVVNDDTLEIPVNLTIGSYSLTNASDKVSYFMVKFDLIDGLTQATLDTVTKELDVARHVQLFNTPQIAPVVKVAHSEISSRANLEIKQVDSGATEIKIYKKSISRATVGIDDYSLVGSYPLTAQQQSLLVQVEKPINSTLLYRAIPVGQLGNIGFEYANAVVLPNRYTPIKAVAINAHTTDFGVVIEVRQIPPTVIAIEVLARNLSNFESIYRNVGDVVSLIDAPTRTSDYISVTDDLVSEGQIYEYVARITHQSGLTELTGNAVINFVKLTPGKVDLQISNLQVTNDGSEPNVTFGIHSTILDQNIDVILTLLNRQDIQQFFANDVAREREFLKGLVAHNVQRVDLTLGTREDFGVVIDEIFDDKKLRKNNSVLPLSFGHKYRYEVMTLIRSPETMFDQFVKTSTDAVTKKAYQFSPSKFLHPLALTEGTLVTSPGLKALYAKDAMSFGVVGTLENVEVSLDDQPARVIAPSASRFNKRLNVITWKLEGAIDQVDHFLIIKDVHGVRTIIGKAHSEFQFGNCQYLHPVTSRDQGELQYLIIPVFNDYRIGIQAITNAVIVE